MFCKNVRPLNLWGRSKCSQHQTIVKKTKLPIDLWHLRFAKRPEQFDEWCCRRFSPLLHCIISSCDSIFYIIHQIKSGRRLRTKRRSRTMPFQFTIFDRSSVSVDIWSHISDLGLDITSPLRHLSTCPTLLSDSDTEWQQYGYFSFSDSNLSHWTCWRSWELSESRGVFSKKYFSSPIICSQR